MKSSFRAFCDHTGLERSALIVAPHPDDEAVGCGGLIALATSAGIDVAVVVVTDGSASHPGSMTWPPQRIAEQRKQETMRALQILGVQSPPCFLELTDSKTGQLEASSRDRVRRRLADLIKAHRPDIVLTTWRREPHCDHRFSYKLARHAIFEAKSRATLVEYMVWTYAIGSIEDRPLLQDSQTFHLDIDEVRTRKRNAVAAHKSQLGRLIRDDPGGFRFSRAQLRSMTKGEEQYELPRSSRI